MAMKKYLLVLTVCLIPFSSFADSGEFDMDRWYTILNDVQNRAIEMGVSNHTINEVIQPSAFIPGIVRKDQNQAEFKKSLDQYLGSAVNADRIKVGRQMEKKYPTLLNRVEQKYGIPGNVILAFWGMESNYGVFKAQYKLSDAFLTLIYDGRRQEFFTNQLFSLMKLADKDKVEISDLTGSWAGAMGHFQFIPTTLEQYGADGNHDGKIDIIHNISDAMYSAGNYLSKMGWNRYEKILRPVNLPSNFDMSLCDGKTKKTLNEWSAFGVTDAPIGEMTAGMICDPAQIDANAATPGYVQVGYLVYPNFYIIKRWNNSNSYAVAIGLLAEKLK